MNITVTPCRELGMVRCPRCQKWCGVSFNYDSLCDDCCEVLVAEYPDHWSVVGIKEARRLQLEAKPWQNVPAVKETR